MDNTISGLDTEQHESEGNQLKASEHEYVLSLPLTAGVMRPDAPKTLGAFVLCFYVVT